MPRRHRRTDGRGPYRRARAWRPDADGTCDTCGKARYRSQGAAARAADLTTPVPGTIGAVAYQCPVNGGWWHYGHRLDYERPYGYDLGGAA